MCGIVGYLEDDGVYDSLASRLPESLEALRHRGPDGSGLWFNSNGVGIGHRRLAILDVSNAGSQPMLSADETLAIVFNGEIYNHAEIAVDLRKLGHDFRGSSDTEVILAAFKEWGKKCVERFIGMFAFAIWDIKLNTIFLCRDRVGVKPLYYRWSGSTLSFASELRALRKLTPGSFPLNSTAIGEFLQYGYIGSPRTIYQDVFKLPPGCWLSLKQGAVPSIEQYWSLQGVVKEGALPSDVGELEERLEELLLSAVKYRMVSDVPVGLFLSGGIDSSLVGALLKKSGVEIETFTVGFDSAMHDESAGALAVATKLGFRNHCVRVGEVDAAKIFALWPDLYDEPFGDHSGIPTYILAKFAREYVTVALSADGGDELFCGYSGYLAAAKRMELRSRIPEAVRSVTSSALSLGVKTGLFSVANDHCARLNRVLGSGIVIDRIHKARDYLGAVPGIDCLRPFRSFWQPGEVQELLGNEYSDPRTGSLSFAGGSLEKIAAQDFFEYLPDDVLAKVDRATMASGLEGREPLLDHRLVEMAFNLPLQMRHGSYGNKHVLRSILYRHIPRGLVDRPKQGFSVPIRSWMEGLIEDGSVQRSCDSLTEKLGFSAKTLRRCVLTFSGSAQGLNRLWLLYCLGRWAQRWI